MANENNAPQHYKKKEITNSMILRRTGLMVSGAAIIASVILIASSCNSAPEDMPEQEITGFTTPVPVSETTVAETEAPLVILPEAEERLKTCKDSAGWVTIDGVVDEEFVHYKDNSFYLDHNREGEHKEGGVIFADFRNVLAGKDASDNIVLYGHNQKDGSRFGQLDFYKWNKNYYKQKPTITLSTNYETSTYKIFAIFITNTEPEDDNGVVFDYHNRHKFNTEAEYQDFIDNCMKRSTILTGVDTQFGDKFLTLSTCSTEFDNSRLVIVARKVREGESEEVDMTNFRINPNPMYPATYYKYMGGSYIEE